MTNERDANTPRPLTDAEMLELLRNPQVQQTLQALAQQEAGATGRTNTERYLDGIAEQHTPEEAAFAYEWVLRYMEMMIKIHPKTRKPHMYFCNIISTERTRAAGLTRAADGYGYIFGIDPKFFSLYYIDQIIDPENETDEEKMWAIIEHSRNWPGGDGRMLHPHLEYLINEDADGKPVLEIWTHEVT